MGSIPASRTKRQASELKSSEAFSFVHYVEGAGLFAKLDHESEKNAGFH
ncbi:hypothetical protein [Comamonas sp. 26]|nr:hypothetical protein [Comamonas sp. 26]